MMSANSYGGVSPNDGDIEHEIASLERQLAEARAKAQARQLKAPPFRSHPQSHLHPSPITPCSISSSPTNLHFLLLLSDSALPLGSFAFSSGLESYLAHQRLVFRRPPDPFHSSFLPLSLSSYASTALPFVLAAHRSLSGHARSHGHGHGSPEDSTPPASRGAVAELAALDDAQDAALVCTVARRASVAQGRALLGIWERSFAGVVKVEQQQQQQQQQSGGGDVLREFSALLRSASSSVDANANGDDDNDEEDQPPPPAVAAHLAPLFGAVCALVGLGPEQTAYVFLLGHVKALVSAAVRAGLFGPYQAQKTLASPTVQGLIAAMVEREWETPVEEAGQNVPVMDLWVGRHEMLYSRIFNS